MTVSPEVYEPEFPPSNRDILTLYDLLKHKFSMLDVGRKIQTFFPVLNGLNPKRISKSLKRKAARAAKLKHSHNYKRSPENKKLNKFMQEKWDLVSEHIHCFTFRCTIFKCTRECVQKIK